MQITRRMPNQFRSDTFIQNNYCIAFVAEPLPQNSALISCWANNEIHFRKVSSFSCMVYAYCNIAHSVNVRIIQSCFVQIFEHRMHV